MKKWIDVHKKSPELFVEILVYDGKYKRVDRLISKGKFEISCKIRCWMYIVDIPKELK